ncbi:MAG: hypothetical protein MH252_14860, partial [Thermosynechococcaceae cyanobacterium MS004]|nr:hypothetical protein [Thermosynechococcaceae cyanobacterium MS004]
MRRQADDGRSPSLHFDHAHEPLPVFPALPPTPIALALPSMAPAPVNPAVIPVVQSHSSKITDTKTEKRRLA